MLDVLGADRDHYAGRHTLVVGAGHSAATTLLALAELAESAPGTRVSWAIRGHSATRSYGRGEADALPARGNNRPADLRLCGLLPRTDNIGGDQPGF